MPWVEDLIFKSYAFHSLRRVLLQLLGKLKVSLKTRKRSIKSARIKRRRKIKSTRSTNIVIKIEVKTRTRRRRKIEVAIMILVPSTRKNIMRRFENYVFCSCFALRKQNNFNIIKAFSNMHISWMILFIMCYSSSVCYWSLPICYFLVLRKCYFRWRLMTHRPIDTLLEWFDGISEIQWYWFGPTVVYYENLFL